MRKNGSVAIVGARVVTPGQDLGVVNVRIEEERIAGVGPDVRPTSADRTIEADGLTLLPGFVDIHSHGRSGCDFCDATDEAFATIGRDKLQDGVTGFLATGLTRPEAELAELCRCAERYKRGTGNRERRSASRRTPQKRLVISDVPRLQDCYGRAAYP